MTYGIKIRGLNNSIPISSFGASLIFRGKAQRVTGTGMTYYPADQFPLCTAVEAFYDTYSYQVRRFSGTTYSYYQGSVPAAPGKVVLIGAALNTAIGTSIANGERAEATYQRNVAIFTYKIVAPTMPIVFFHTSSSDTRATVVSVTPNGTEGGAPVWYIKVSIGFLAGTAEATFASHLTLYCFSKVVNSDFSASFGVRTFDAHGNPAYSSELKPLRAKDYVTLTATDTPTNISNMIITREFCPTPEISMFSMSKPSFQNIDFARYGSRVIGNNVFGFNYLSIGLGYIGGRNRYLNFLMHLESHIAAGGVNIKNGELNFGLTVVDAEWVPFDFTISASQPMRPSQSLPSQYISYKRELFPCTIPVIDGAEYD